MVRKTKTNACPVKTTPDDPEKKTFLILASFPVVMVFNLIRFILFELFVVLKFVYNSSSRLLLKPTAAGQQEVNLESVNLDNQENKGAAEMDLLQLQKYHHKKAFEFISQALVSCVRK